MKIKSFLSFVLIIITPVIFADNASLVISKHSMVVSEHWLATETGITILRAGGNAVDAAVAVGYALAVVNPCCGNIGGGGFMTIHLADGQNIFLNFREKAPLLANQNMYLGKSNDAMIRGYLSVAVPGTVLGMDTALQKFGTFSRKQVMAPAIRLAEEGFIISPFLAELMAEFTHSFRSQPTVAAIFLNNDRPFKAGERLIQHDLANTLKQIAEKGPDFFYKGPIARAIVEASQQNGGILTLADFANYTVQVLKPIQCTYQGYTLISAPPPSSGGVTLCEILNILENFPIKYFGYRSFQSVQVLVEAMRYGFFDRNTNLGDPDFVKNPVDKLISKTYAAEISKKINQVYFAKPIDFSPRKELTDTTHYSVMDSKGNAVSVTYTINNFFGSQMIADHTGFFLNDEMDDFTTKKGVPNKFELVQSRVNDIEPGKRPLSSMSPTIVLKDGRVVMVLGSPGGPRIITSVLLTLINVIDYGMNIQQAVDAPRFHFQGIPNVIDVEPIALPFATEIQLKIMGYPITQQGWWGAVEAIRVDNGLLYGKNDIRRPDGKAIGD